MSINIVKDDLFKGMAPNASLDTDVNLMWLYFAGKAEWTSVNTLRTTTSYADKAIEVLYQWVKGISTGVHALQARSDYDGFAGSPNYYALLTQPDASTHDFRLDKRVTGTITELGYEAADMTAGQTRFVKLSCSSTTIKGYYKSSIGDAYPAAQISVTDSDVASGKMQISFGERYYVVEAPTNATEGPRIKYINTLSAVLRDAGSPTAEALAYFEAPVTGSGTLEDPFRVDMPKEIVDNKNRLALTASAHIPSDSKTGKPIHGTAILRVWESAPSPERRSVEECVKAVGDMPKCLKLKRERAIDLALERDDKLFIHDLLPCTKHPESPTSKCCKEHIEWREKTLGLNRDLIDDTLMAHYVKEPKW